MTTDMKLEVQLDDAEALSLRRKAESLGQELAGYVADVLRREARRPVRSFEQIAEDIEKRRGGPLDMGDDEIAEMLEVAKP